MKLPAETGARRAASLISTIALAALLAGCGNAEKGGAELASAAAAPITASGPAADYPVVLGDPYEIDGVLYTPTDALNHDEVGIALAEDEGGSTISAAHRTLPLPSYVEVTSLENGRTILVRVMRRGPMAGDAVIGLSPGALTQLGLVPGTAVRVRRVNPPEQERALLRGGDHAPLRMDTPMSLVEVLKRRLQEKGSAPLAHGETPPVPAAEPESVAPPEQAAVTPALPALAQPPEPEAPAPATAQAAPAASGNFAVQAGAFANSANADKVANVIGGTITKNGNLYIVRTGPFETRSQAEASLAKVRAAGYREARIFTGG
jgi:rare lipoprotein A